MRRRWGVALGMALLIGVGCSEGAQEDMMEDGPEDQGLALSIGVDEEREIQGFEFQIDTCDGESVVEAYHDWEELVMPGGLVEDLETPPEVVQGHRFADFFTPLESGCYDISVQPMDAHGEASSECAQAVATEVFVVGHKTTEVLLLSQCEGAETGAADIAAALNHPPEIVAIDYDPSKFVHECELATICVDAMSPDGDPLEFEVEQTAGQQLRFPVNLLEAQEEDGVVRQCFEAVPLWYDDYAFKVRVYDQVWEDDSLVRVDDAIAAESRAVINIPLYSNWDTELECYDDEDEVYYPFLGVREIERAPGCIPIWPHEYYCSDFWWDDLERTCPDGEFKPESVYPLCSDHEGQYDTDRPRQGTP